MLLMRSRLAQRAAVLTLVVGAVVASLPATAQTTVRQSEPSTTWNAEFPRPATGLSTWLATFAEPTAGPGQSAPDYAYFLDFTLNFSTADFISYGRISLDVEGNQRFATLSITESDIEGGRAHRVRVPLSWSGNRFYFLWVNRLADGLFGGWAYDVAEATWTYIGAVVVPPALQTVDSLPRTGVEWTGTNLATCDAYPQAVVVFRAPVAYHGSAAPTQGQLGDRSPPAPPPDCPSTAASFLPEWDYYVAGSEPAPVGG